MIDLVVVRNSYHSLQDSRLDLLNGSRVSVGHGFCEVHGVRYVQNDRSYVSAERGVLWVGLGA